MGAPGRQEDRNSAPPRLGDLQPKPVRSQGCHCGKPRGGRGRVMRVLVTGGAGFIGSHLADRLIALGYDVVVIDNESTGLRENVPAAAHYIKGNVSNREDLEQAFAVGLDAVCHIAGQVSLIRSFTDPTIDLRTNVEGTLNVLQLCLKYRVARLLYAGSMTAYGN